MRINELTQEQIVVGLRIKSLVSDKLGTIVEVDHKDDDYAWIRWDGDDKPYSGFYGTDCECEVVVEVKPIALGR